MNRHVRSLLSTSRTLAAPVTEIGVIRFVLLLAFCCVAAYYVFPRSQSFTVVASTQSVTVTFSEQAQNAWMLKNATLCLRHSRAAQPAPSGAKPTRCDPDYYDEVKAQQIEILWTAGHRLSVSGHDDTQLVVSIDLERDGLRAHFGEHAITDNSVLFFDRASIDSFGGLVAQGQVEIGELAEAGAANLTRGGTYQIRENLGFPSRKAVVASGDILTGDLVRLTDRAGRGINATMLLTQSGDALADFDVVMTSPERPSAIEITRIGGAQSTISTRWMDRIANDALPVALSILLGLLGASLGIVRSLASGAKPPPN